MPLRFELVLGLFIQLKKQFEEEEKERKRQEEEANGGQGFDVNGYMGQARSMMSSAQSQVRMPSGISMPSMPHI